jgi:hypothetical protein
VWLIACIGHAYRVPYENVASLVLGMIGAALRQAMFHLYQQLLHHMAPCQRLPF